MEYISLFTEEDNLCNPSIVEYNDSIVGLVKEWDFDSNPHFEGNTYLFKVNKENYELDMIKEVKCLSGLRDYTLFKSREGLYALCYHKNRIYFVVFNDEGESIEELNVEGLPSLYDYSNKNFSPIEKDGYTIDFVYSFNPFNIIRIKEDGFIHLPITKKSNINLKLHGGTRFIHFNDNELISVYHTYEGEANRYYKVYLVTISNDYPYKPMRISNKPILEGNMVGDNIKPNKKCKWLNEKAKVVFERGIAKLDNKYIISYGVQDRESWLLTATYNELDSLLDKTIDIEEVN